MKQTLCSLSVVAALAAVSPAFAADGVITINGEVTDATCTASVNGGAANATLVLPTVAASALSQSGETAATTPFSIALSGCSGQTLSNASTLFEMGATVDAATGRLNSSGSATGVQVQLLNANSQPIVVGGANQNDVPVDISSGAGTLNYYAQYYATAPATAGTVSTSVEYTVIYD